MKRKHVVPQVSESYRSVFRKHAHLLIAWGYKRAESNFNDMDEESISDALYGSINNLLYEQSRFWMSNYAVKNEDPIIGGRRTGKRRRRMDLVIVKTIKGRPKYVCEAKILNYSKRHHRARQYLDPKDGLGRFLEGEYADYTADHPEIIMLGYMLDRTPEEWREDLQRTLEGKTKELNLIGEPEDVEIVDEIKFEWCSQHERVSSQSHLVVYHIILDCS